MLVQLSSASNSALMSPPQMGFYCQGQWASLPCQLCVQLSESSEYGKRVSCTSHASSVGGGGSLFFFDNRPIIHNSLIQLINISTLTHNISRRISCHTCCCWRSSRALTSAARYWPRYGNTIETHGERR